MVPAGARRAVDDATLARMRDAFWHRGPDGAGAFVERYDDGSGVALGHRLLAIVDVAHGGQPFASEDGRYQVVYNGEVYNHPTEMRALEAEGVRYRTRCDTETVLHLFERHGARTPERLRGMFGVAAWDRARRELVLMRDRFGVKPVYYVHAEDGSLYFASEIKGLLESGAVRPELNWRALPDFLANHAPSGDQTLFMGVRRLLPGHTLTWRDGRIELRRYWDLSYAAEGTNTRSEADLVAEYEERFREAVRVRLMADVPLGMFLSGGVDSASITAAMSQLVDDQIKTFSVAFAERDANELDYARLVAKQYKTDHHEIVVSPDDFFGALPSLVWHEDEPLAHPSSVALNFVSRLAAERVKVVLTGEGSDETLAGYNRYRATILQMAAGGRYESLIPGPLRSIVRATAGALPAGRVRQRLGRTILTRPATVDALYFENFAVFGRAQQCALLTRQARERVAGVDPYAAYHEALARTDARTLLDRLLYADTKTYLHELLMKQDQMSMAASIESRVPFLDHPLVEWVATLPDNMKLRGYTTKHILREAMRPHLPAEILSRKKMGFPVPVGAWFRGAYRHVVDEYVLSERALARGVFEPAAVRALVARHAAGENHSERLWALVTFEMWQRIFFDGEAVEPADSPARRAAAPATAPLPVGAA